MERPITHRGLGERATFDAEGLRLWRWLDGALVLPWSALDCVCVTPAQERTPAGWRTKALPGLADVLGDLQRRGALTLDFVVKDRRAHLGPQLGWWRRVAWGARLRSMAGAEAGAADPRALLELRVELRRLDADKDALLSLLEAHCRFELLVFDWPD